MSTRVGFVAPMQWCSSGLPSEGLRWCDDAFDDFKHRIRQLTGRSWGVSMGYRLYKLAQYIRGWMGYFAISDYYRPVPELDGWLRRRIRMCYWKQWATRSHQSSPPPRARHEQTPRHSHRLESQGLLASRENPGNPNRNDEPLARTSRAALYPPLVDEGPWLRLNASCAPSSGTAPCGPACGVVWGGGAKHSPLPDYARSPRSLNSKDRSYPAALDSSRDSMLLEVLAGARTPIPLRDLELCSAIVHGALPNYQYLQPPRHRHTMRGNEPVHGRRNTSE